MISNIVSSSYPDASIKDDQVKNVSHNEKASGRGKCCDHLCGPEFFNKADSLNGNHSNHYNRPLELEIVGDKISSRSKEIELGLPTKEKGGEVNYLVPRVGMEFKSEEEAYEFYKYYAKEITFTVRKGKVTRFSDGTIRKRYFFCSRQGFKSSKKPNMRKKRLETRTGCNANIQIQVENEKWVISKCFLEHNHELERPFQKNAMTTEINDHYELMSISNTSNVPMVQNECGTTKYAILQEVDSRNYLCSGSMNTLKPEDVQSLMDCFSNEQLEDPLFFYTIQVDGENHMANFFWRDGRSRIDYKYFGDVLVLDTTVRLNNMICAPFWGLNHHQQCVLFGWALLLDDNLDSLVWLLNNFLKAMGNCQPKTFYTDESQIMATAVETVFSQSQHRFGLSFLYKNAENKHLATFFEQPSFEIIFEKCIFHCQSKQEFESLWASLFEQYGLRENPWLSSLYMSREKWSHLFTKTTFTAGIEAMLNTKSNNVVLSQNSTGEIRTLSNLFHQYVKTTEQLRLEELQEDLCCHKIVTDRPRHGMEKHAEDIYTWKVFQKFENEFYGILSLAIEEITNSGTISMFKLTEEGHNKEYVVAFECSSYTVTCTCAKFESSGLLCVHCLKVLNSRNIFQIPSQHVLKRWTKFAREGLMMERLEKDMVKKVQKQSSLYLKNIVPKALMVFTKGATNEECRTIIEGHMEMASKEVDDVLRAKAKEKRNAIENSK